MDTIMLQTLRERIISNTDAMKQLTDEMQLRNLLTMLELELIKKEDVLRSPIYQKYISEHPVKKR